jgi:D-amino peptidase
MSMRAAAGLAVLLHLLAVPAFAAEPPPLRVFISVDMEGVAGVATEQQLGPQGFEYARFREFMTKEALAAVNGARAAGATTITVADSHGNYQNLLIEQFPDDVRVVRGGPRPLGMMGGLDAGYDAVVFVGYHASTANVAGVRAHTFSSARLAGVKLNGREMTEGSWNAALAGHYGIPVVFVSGDGDAVREVQAVLGSIEAVETKRSLGFHATETLTPAASAARIEAGVKRALGRRAQATPYRLPAPVTLDVTFKNYRPAEVASWLRGVQRVDSHTIRYVGQDMAEVVAFEVFLTNYSVELEP